MFYNILLKIYNYLKTYIDLFNNLLEYLEELKLQIFTQKYLCMY